MVVNKYSDIGVALGPEERKQVTCTSGEEAGRGEGWEEGGGKGRKGFVRHQRWETCAVIAGPVQGGESGCVCVVSTPTA